MKWLNVWQPRMWIKLDWIIWNLLLHKSQTVVRCKGTEVIVFNWNPGIPDVSSPSIVGPSRNTSSLLSNLKFHRTAQRTTEEKVDETGSNQSMKTAQKSSKSGTSRLKGRQLWIYELRSTTRHSRLGRSSYPFGALQTHPISTSLLSESSKTEVIKEWYVITTPEKDKSLVVIHVSQTLPLQYGPVPTKFQTLPVQ